MPVIAQVTISEKTLSAEKLFRVTNNPVGKNPVISGVQLDWNATAVAQTRIISKKLKISSLNKNSHLQ